jgi:hypothetical protein
LLGRILELALTLFLLGFFGYRFEDETVCGASGAFCRPSDALL